MPALTKPAAAGPASQRGGRASAGVVLSLVIVSGLSYWPPLG